MLTNPSVNGPAPTLAEQILTAADGTQQIVLLASETGVSLTGAVADTWLDQSGLGRNATATTTLRPTYSATALNGKPGLVFNGSNRMIVAAHDLSAFDTMATIALFSDSNADLVLALERSVSTSAVNGGWFLGVNESTVGSVEFVARQSGTFTGIRTAAGHDMSAPKVVTGTWAQGHAISETEIRIDGANESVTPIVNGDTSGGFGNLAMYIGGRANGTLTITGVFGAVIVLATNGMTASFVDKVTRIESLLKSEWGV